MLISWARGMSPVTPLLPLSLFLSLRCYWNCQSPGPIAEWISLYIHARMYEEAKDEAEYSCVSLKRKTRPWLLAPMQSRLSTDECTHIIYGYMNLRACMCVCVWALWLLTRERVFWLMMIHEINFNSYDQRLFAFEMKAFSHRFTIDPLAPRCQLRRLWRSRLCAVLRKIILVSSLINTCFVTALIR